MKKFFNAEMVRDLKLLNINTNLLIKKDISKKNIKRIIKLHKKLNKIFDKEYGILQDYKAENISRKKFDKKVSKIDKKIKKIEFKLQKAWGFPKNESYHQYWYRQPACSCPKLDNDELLGKNFKIINSDCLVHGLKDDDLESQEKSKKPKLIRKRRSDVTYDTNTTE